MNSRPRLALLIDSENVSYKRAAEIFSRVSLFGDPVIRVAFGDWTTPQLSGWQEVARARAIRLGCQQPCTPYKDGSDIALTVEAMDLLHRYEPDGFVIVSGDSDFTPLVTRLREQLLPVYVFGGANTPPLLRASCTEFLELTAEREDLRTTPALTKPTNEVPAKKVAAKKVAAPRTIQPVTPKLEKRLHRAIKESAGNDGWATISSVAKQLGPGIRPKSFGHATWTKLFVGRKGFEVRNAKKPNAAVRSTA